MTLLPTIRAGFSGLLDLVFPHRCPGCGADCVAEQIFCSRCVDSVHAIAPPLCPRCFLPYPSGETRLCSTCRKTPPPFHQAVALFEYGGQVAHAVRAIKYQGQLPVARVLGGLMSAHLSALAPDVVVPVPLHRKRLARRGFNHAAELARWACKGLPFRVKPTVLSRREEGPPQAGSTLAQRRALSARAFAVVRPNAVRGKNVVLVDDVMTTKATAAACSRALIKAGAKRVDVLVLCRSVR